MNKQYPTVNVYALSDPKSRAIHKQQDTKDAYRIGRIPWVYAHMDCERYIDEVQQARDWYWEAPDLITMDKSLDDLADSGVFHARLYDRDCVLILAKEKVSKDCFNGGYEELPHTRKALNKADLDEAFSPSGMLKALQRGDTHLGYENPEMKTWLEKEFKAERLEFTSEELDAAIFGRLTSSDKSIQKVLDKPENQSICDKYDALYKQYRKDNPKPPCWNLHVKIVDILLGKHKLPKEDGYDYGYRYFVEEKSKRVKGILSAPHQITEGLRYLDGDFTEPVDLSNLANCKHLSTLDFNKSW